MNVRTVATTIDCEGGNCPTTYVTEVGGVIVQGFQTGRSGQVRVPASLLDRHAELEGGTRWSGPADEDQDGWVIVAGADLDRLDDIEVPEDEALVVVRGSVIA
ncbi:hypothetical protein PSU4_60110 [Pseudonocardia sulfidoxydans NBRC 16205]|uniref:Uncharacterized protein n=1 Tax=Pseudonocardia sulfidoxydans NBRC 16205 TaxID=1223511 RepID=A0A511DRY0_9PSEU|nr:hypothetical protein PSU4_60110 [Pseudonocardia sulfidoxydans NBRC 16205]